MAITRVSPPPNMSLMNTSVWRDWYSKVHTLLNYVSASNTSLGQQFTIKLTSGSAIAGIGLATTPTGSANATSAIIIQADKFAIVPSSYSGGPIINPSADKLPFAVDGTGIYITSAVRIDGSLIVNGTITLSELATGTLDYANITGATKPADNADVTLSAVNGGLSVTGGGITLSGGGAIKGGQTAYDTGTGFFLGYSSSVYKFSIGNSAGNKLTWNGTVLNIVGDLSGTSNISITGNAFFQGVNNPGTGDTYTIIASGATGSNSGLYAVGNLYGVTAYSPGGVGLNAMTATGTALKGIASSGGTGLYVSSDSYRSINSSTNTGYAAYLLSTGSGGHALYAEGQDSGTEAAFIANGTVGGVALKLIGQLNFDPAAIGTGTATATDAGSTKPGSNTTNTWLKILVGGTPYYIKAWT